MGLSAFLSENARPVENVRYAVSPRFLGAERDEQGNPLPELWEIRCLTSTEEESIRRECTKRVPVPGKRGQFTQETDYNLYLGRLAAACTVYPNLNDKELQDSYGVMGADVLLKTMLSPGEYTDYLGKVQEVNGFDRSFQDEVDETKN